MMVFIKIKNTLLYILKNIFKAKNEKKQQKVEEKINRKYITLKRRDG